MYAPMAGCRFVYVIGKRHGIKIDSLICWFIDSSTHPFTESLIHWFIDSQVHPCIDSLMQWLTESPVRWAIDSLIFSLIHRFITPPIHLAIADSLIHRLATSFSHWFTDSWIHRLLNGFCIDSLIHWFTGWLIHWVIASLLHWFMVSFTHWFIGSSSRWLFGSFTQLCNFSFIDAPHNFNTSLLLHRKNFPIGHWFPIAMSYFRNFRPGAGRALPGCVVWLWDMSRFRANSLCARKR